MFKRSFVLAAVAALFALPAIAADLPVKALPFGPSAAPCVPQNCSGWYAGFGVLGDGSNADIIGSGINGSVFSSGGAIKVQGGYQLWNGAFFAAIEGALGYEFTTNVSGGVPVVEKGGSRLIGTELIKLGYNFFPSPSLGVTTPGQAPLPMTLSANLLASSTPFLVFGGLQRKGVNEWVNGAGVQTYVAAGWTTEAKYLYAPAQQGQPATSIVTLELNKHF